MFKNCVEHVGVASAKKGPRWLEQDAWSGAKHGAQSPLRRQLALGNAGNRFNQLTVQDSRFRLFVSKKAQGVGLDDSAPESKGPPDAALAGCQCLPCTVATRIRRYQSIHIRFLCILFRTPLRPPGLPSPPLSSLPIAQRDVCWLPRLAEQGMGTFRLSVSVSHSLLTMEPSQLRRDRVARAGGFPGVAPQLAMAPDDASSASLPQDNPPAKPRKV